MADKFVYEFSLVFITSISLGLLVGCICVICTMVKSLYTDMKELIRAYRENKQ